MRDDSGLHLKSISAQLQREREANVGDVSNCDKPEGKTNDLGMEGETCPLEQGSKQRFRPRKTVTVQVPGSSNEIM